MAVDVKLQDRNGNELNVEGTGGGSSLPDDRVYLDLRDKLTYESTLQDLVNILIEKGYLIENQKPYYFYLVAFERFGTTYIFENICITPQYGGYNVVSKHYNSIAETSDCTITLNDFVSMHYRFITDKTIPYPMSYTESFYSGSENAISVPSQIKNIMLYFNYSPNVGDILTFYNSQDKIFMKVEIKEETTLFVIKLDRVSFDSNYVFGVNKYGNNSITVTDINEKENIARSVVNSGGQPVTLTSLYYTVTDGNGPTKTPDIKITFNV